MGVKMDKEDKEILDRIKARKEANFQDGLERVSQNWGGVRVPGPGKSLGRPKKPQEEKAVTKNFRLDPDTLETLIELADMLDKSQTDIIRMALHDMGVEYDIVDGPWMG
jgi:hypothetical protein